MHFQEAVSCDFCPTKMFRALKDLFAFIIWMKLAIGVNVNSTSGKFISVRSQLFDLQAKQSNFAAIKCKIVHDKDFSQSALVHLLFCIA